MDWKAIRENYPLLERVTYLNTASSGPISINSADALKSFVQDMLTNGSLNRSKWLERIDHARKISAKLLSARTKEIGFMSDVSTAMNLVATSITSRKRIILIEDDFPSTALPWISYGYEIIWISRNKDQSINYEAIEQSLAKGADILAISWIHYNSGIETNLTLLGEMCKNYGAMFIVDGTQGLGAAQIDVKSSHISIFMASTFKWLNAGYGSCILYINDNCHEELSHCPLGWNSLTDFNAQLTNQDARKSGALRWESGHWSYMNLAGLATALSEIYALGVPKIEIRVGELKTKLIHLFNEVGVEVLTPNLDSHRGGILTIRGNKELFQKLQAQQVITTFRKDYLRISFHYYNDESDFDTLLGSLE